MGKLRPAKNKSDIPRCILPVSPVTVNKSPTVDAKIIDGAIIVNRLQPRECKTFEQYAQKMFAPCIESVFKVIKRVNIVWGRYFSHSLKNSTRENRGEGIRRKVTDTGLLPKNWITFLRCSENKKELFSYLTKVATQTISHLLLSTSDKDVCCSKTLDMQGRYEHIICTC